MYSKRNFLFDTVDWAPENKGMARQFGTFKLSRVGKIDCRASRTGAVTGKIFYFILSIYSLTYMEKSFQITNFRPCRDIFWVFFTLKSSKVDLKLMDFVSNSLSTNHIKCASLFDTIWKKQTRRLINSRWSIKLTLFVFPSSFKH